jgi:hypothetical protein
MLWIRIRNNKQMTSQNVWNMSLFKNFFKVLSLYLKARIRIRFKVKGRIMIRINVTSRIQMRVRNNDHKNHSNTAYREHTGPLFDTHRILPLHKLVKYSNFMHGFHGIVYGFLPLSFSECGPRIGYGP